MCLVKFDEDDKWYRGLMAESVGDGHPSIIFIDFGNVALVNIKNIRRMPKEFAFPIYTHLCFIHGI